MKLLAIDPGKCTGWAYFEDGQLTSCDAGDEPPRSLLISANLVIIEKPQVYRGHLQKGDPNDLITLAIQVGRYVERAKGGVLLVKPATWKGQVPKAVHHERIRALLSTRETEVLNNMSATASKAHNALDAVGLGLWRLERCAA